MKIPGLYQVLKLRNTPNTTTTITATTITTTTTTTTTTTITTINTTTTTTTSSTQDHCGFPEEVYAKTPGLYEVPNRSYGKKLKM